MTTIQTTALEQALQIQSIPHAILGHWFWNALAKIRTSIYIAFE